MKNITLKQLRYFESLSRHGHFGRAADACMISQPALSMQIKELEDGLGTPLFERNPNGIALTGFGKDFAIRVRDILRAVDELGDLARATTDQLSGMLRVGVIPTVAPYLLPQFINRIKTSHPALELQIRETLTQRLISELSRGELDAAIVALPISEPSFAEVPLFDEEFLLVRPVQDDGKPVPSGDRLVEEKLLLLEEGHCFRDQALSFCNVPNMRPWDGLDGSSLSTLVQMVSAGMGVTLIPEMAIPVETRSAPVSVARFDGPKPSRTIGMVWRQTNPLGKQFSQIADAVREAASRKI